jgi:hypothetical protein
MEAPLPGSYANAVTRNFPPKNVFENLLPNDITSFSNYSPITASMRNKNSVHFIFTAPFPTQQEVDNAITRHGSVIGSSEVINPTNIKTKIHEVFFQNPEDTQSALEHGAEFPKLDLVRALQPRPYTANTK